MSGTPLVRFENVSIAYRNGKTQRRGGPRRRPHHRRGRDLRAGGGERQRQEHARPGAAAGAPAHRVDQLRAHLVPRRGPRGALSRAPSHRAAPEGRARAAGPPAVAQPRPHDPRAAARGARAGRPCGTRCPRPRPGHARGRRDGRSRAGGGRVPAPALGRHAATRTHRHGPRGRAGPARPRRAHDEPRRHHRGDHPRPRQGAGSSARHGRALRLAQPGGRRAAVRPRRRPLRGRGGGGRRRFAGSTGAPCTPTPRASSAACRAWASNRREVGLRPIEGRIPPPTDLPPGCVFAPRCPLALDACRAARPALEEPEGRGRRVRCIRWREIAAGEADPTSGSAVAPARAGAGRAARTTSRS